MPEGPLGFPRATNLGPLSRETAEEVREHWDVCPQAEKPQEICREIKFTSLIILENEGFFASCQTLEEINSGRCHDVASRVSSELPYVTQVETWGGDHGWIKHNGIHYDAEKPTGVEDPFDLPFFDRVGPQRVLRIAKLGNSGLPNRGSPPETLDDLIVEVETQRPDRIQEP